MDTSGAELEEMRARLAALESKVAAMTGTVGDDHAAPNAVASSMPAGPPRDETADRRRFMRLAAGGVATAGVITAGAVAGADKASALTNDPLLIGKSNAATLSSDVTEIVNPGGTFLQNLMFWVNNATTFQDPSFPPNNSDIAIAGTVSSTDVFNNVRTGVYGRATGSSRAQGVYGGVNGALNSPMPTVAHGVVGAGGAGDHGVTGIATGATGNGVHGQCIDGTGVAGRSTNGVSLHALDGGRIRQDLRAAGPPAAGTFATGEQIRDANGHLYLCVAGGTPGTWQKVAANAPGFQNAGGSINLLAKPIRIMDTRGNGAPITNGGNRLNGQLQIQVTGTVVGGISVPAGAKGITANLTATSALADGWLATWPSGAFPGTSSLNYSVATANPAIANFFLGGLDATGKMNVMSVSAVHVILDVTGFVY